MCRYFKWIHPSTFYLNNNCSSNVRFGSIQHALQFDCSSLYCLFTGVKKALPSMNFGDNIEF